MKLKNYFTFALLTVSITLAPVGITMAQAASENSVPIKVAFLGLGHKKVVSKDVVVVKPKKHKLLKAAAVVGGVLVARHMWKKHQLKKAAKAAATHK